MFKTEPRSRAIRVGGGHPYVKHMRADTHLEVYKQSAPQRCALLGPFLESLVALPKSNVCFVVFPKKMKVEFRGVSFVKLSAVKLSTRSSQI